MLPYVVTLIVLIIVSLRKKREDQPPASLGLTHRQQKIFKTATVSVAVFDRITSPARTRRRRVLAPRTSVFLPCTRRGKSLNRFAPSAAQNRARMSSSATYSN